MQSPLGRDRREHETSDTGFWQVSNTGFIMQLQAQCKRLLDNIVITNGPIIADAVVAVVALVILLGAI